MGVNVAMGFPPGVGPGAGGAISTIIDQALSTQRAALQVLLPFDDTSGAVARDISGLNRPGAYSAVGVTLGQAGPDTGRTSAALAPAAGNVYIDVYNAAWKDVPATGEWSVMICGKFDDMTDAGAEYILWLSADSNNQLRLDKVSASSLRVYLIGGGTSATITFSNVKTFDWLCMLITVSKSNNRLRWYCNGYNVSELSDFGTWSGSLSSSETLVGARTKTGTSELDGNVYGFGVWSAELTPAEAQAITQYYRPTCYVDVASGNDANNGLSSDTAVATLNTGLYRVAPGGGYVYINAPGVTPVPNAVAWSYKSDLSMCGLDSALWYSDLGTSYTSGWTDAGGGIYSRALAADPGLVSVPTIDDGNGLATLLWYAGATASPAEGKYGYTGGTLYIYLPSAADPNSHTIRVASASKNITQSGLGVVSISDAVLRYGASGIFASSGTLVVNDSIAEFCNDGGFDIDTAATLTNCIGRKCRNDGFNISAAGGETITLNACSGLYNLDEGASPHSTSNLVVNGGEYAYNGQGGITAVQNSVCTISSVRSHHNGQQGGQSVGNRGGINFTDAAAGTITDCETDNNSGEGVYINTTGTVTVTNLDSHDNTESDVIP